MFEHTEDGMEEFAHDGDQSNHLGLAASSQMFIEGAPVGLAAKGDQGGHVEGAAQVDVAAFAEARLLVHGAARSGSDRCLPEGTAEFHTPSPRATRWAVRPLRLSAPVALHSLPRPDCQRRRHKRRRGAPTTRAAALPAAPIRSLARTSTTKERPLARLSASASTPSMGLLERRPLSADPVMECGSLLPLSKAAASRRTPNRRSETVATTPPRHLRRHHALRRLRWHHRHPRATRRAVQPLRTRDGNRAVAATHKARVDFQGRLRVCPGPLAPPLGDVFLHLS